MPTNDEIPDGLTEPIYHFPARYPGENPVLQVCPSGPSDEYLFEVVGGLAILVAVRRFGPFDHVTDPGLQTPIPETVAAAVKQYDEKEDVKEVANPVLPDDSQQFTQTDIEAKW